MREMTIPHMPVSPPFTSLTPRAPPSESSRLLFPISPTAVPYPYPVIWRRTFIPIDKIYQVLCPTSSFSPFISSKLIICVLWTSNSLQWYAAILIWFIRWCREGHVQINRYQCFLTQTLRLITNSCQYYVSNQPSSPFQLQPQWWVRSPSFRQKHGRGRRGGGGSRFRSRSWRSFFWSFVSLPRISARRGQ